MLIVYAPLAETQKEAFVREHPRGLDIVRAIENDLSRDPISRAAKLAGGVYAQIFTPEIEPPIEIRLSYLIGDKILIKVFRALTV